MGLISKTVKKIKNKKKYKNKNLTNPKVLNGSLQMPNTKLHNMFKTFYIYLKYGFYFIWMVPLTHSVDNK